MAGQELDRNEAATPHKLGEARKRGQVARSSDLVAAAVFAAAVVYLHARGWETLVAQFTFDQRVLAHAGADRLGPGALWWLVDRSLREALLLLLPLLATILIAAVASNVVQVGAVFSTHPLGPDWQRIDLATGLRRLSSMRTLVDAVRAVVKFLVLSFIVYAALRALVPQFNHVATLPPLGFLHLMVRDAASVGAKLALALCVIALLDVAWTRHEYARRMRMSRREVKDEVKQRDGDPRIRARLRELRRQMLERSRSISRTRDADVVIVNPAHVAVALKYRHGEMDAPVLIAKGVGAVASGIRRVAGRHRVPVVRNVALARALFAGVEVDATIPEAQFSAVARVMVWVFAMRDAARAASPAGAAA
jgi:flagellar biosynthetic protein FlhB